MGFLSRDRTTYCARPRFFLAQLTILSANQTTLVLT